MALKVTWRCIFKNQSEPSAITNQSTAWQNSAFVWIVRLSSQARTISPEILISAPSRCRALRQPYCQSNIGNAIASTCFKSDKAWLAVVDATFHREFGAGARHYRQRHTSPAPLEQVLALTVKPRTVRQPQVSAQCYLHLEQTLIEIFARVVEKANRIDELEKHLPHLLPIPQL